MVLSRIDAALLALSLLGQVALFFVLWRRRSYKAFPIFSLYILYTLFSDLLLLPLIWAQNVSKQTYFTVYFANNVPEFLLQLGILYEVARNVLSPVKRSLPKSALTVLLFMVVSGTILACFLSVHSMPSQLNHWSQYFIQINFTVAILRLVIFSAIVFFSQMLGIGWRNHVVQIATGFAGYSVVVLLVELLHRFTGVTNDSVYHFQEQFRIVAWCLALAYWSYVLAKKEAPRKDFDPQMANFLVSISGRVSKDRAAAVRFLQK